MKNEHDITQLCAALGVTRAGYYAWLSAPACQRDQTDEALLPQIAALHQKHDGNYGAPRIQKLLKEGGQHHGCKRIARIMRRHGINGSAQKSFVPCTTDSNHREPIAENLLPQQPPLQRPNQVWVSDLTYVDTQEGWLYVAVIMDLWSRRIVGWACGATLHCSLALSALQMALQHRQPQAGLLHHSDRGVQYACAQYRRELEQARIVRSMSRKGNPYDNAAMESFMATYKRERVRRDGTYLTRQQAATSFFHYVECYYNRERLHSSLGYKSPVDFENTLN